MGEAQEAAERLRGRSWWRRVFAGRVESLMSDPYHLELWSTDRRERQSPANVEAHAKANLKATSPIRGGAWSGNQYRRGPWRERMRWLGQGTAAGRTPPTLPKPQPYRARPVPTYRLGHLRSRRGIAPVTTPLRKTPHKRSAGGSGRFSR